MKRTIVDRGALAQLVERHNGIVEASGSNPLCSTIFKDASLPSPKFLRLFFGGVALMLTWGGAVADAKCVARTAYPDGKWRAGIEEKCTQYGLELKALPKILNDCPAGFDLWACEVSL